MRQTLNFPTRRNVLHSDSVTTHVCRWEGVFGRSNNIFLVHIMWSFSISYDRWYCTWSIKYYHGQLYVHEMYHSPNRINFVIRCREVSRSPQVHGQIDDWSISPLKRRRFYCTSSCTNKTYSTHTINKRICSRHFTCSYQIDNFRYKRFIWRVIHTRSCMQAFLQYIVLSKQVLYLSVYYIA